VYKNEVRMPDHPSKRAAVSTWAALDAVPIGLIAWREDGAIVAANEAAAALLGHPRDGLLERSYWALTLPGQRQREVTAARCREAYDKEFLDAEGAPITARVVGVGPAPGEPDDVHLCAFTIGPGEPGRDVEAALRRHNRLLQRLAQSREIDSGDLSQALPLLTEVAAEGLGCARASVWVYGPGATSIVCSDLYMAATHEHARGGELSASDFPAYFAALAENRTIAASDAHTDPATREFSAVYLTPLGIGAMLDAPIRHGGEVRGVLCHEHVGGPRQFSQDEQNFAASLADVVARALTAADRRAAEEALAQARVALERYSAELEAQVTAHARELARVGEENRGLVERLRRSVEVLSSPVIEVWDGVLAVPVIGDVDAEQSARMTDRLLAELTRTRARHVILDLTGLSRCDPRTAESLGRTARAVALLGAECVLSGLRPTAAQTLVEHGIDLSRLTTRRNLQQALQEILAPPRRGG
jgi:rsbT co-antagonist protein RsbR